MSEVDVPRDCDVCHQPLAGEPTRVLRCMHAFHDECITSYESASNTNYNDGTMRCPMCKITSNAAAENEERFLATACAPAPPTVVPAVAIVPGEPISAVSPIDVRSPSPGAPDGISGESEIVVEHSPEISVSVERDQVPPATSVQSGIATEPSVNPGVPLIPSVSFWNDVTFPCEMCGSACKLDRLRIASKKQGTYKCKQCLTRYSMLQRTLGSWPPPFWGSTTEEQKYQFWKSPGTTNGELFSELKRLESQVESNMKYNNWDGEFQPLSYWKQLGYDPELIQQNTREEDQEFNPQLGQTYRVQVHKTGSQHSRCTETRETLEGLFGRQRLAAGSNEWQALPLSQPATSEASGACGPPAASARPNASDSSDSSSEESSSEDDAMTEQEKLRKVTARAKSNATKVVAKAKKQAKRDTDKKRKRDAKAKQKAGKKARKTQQDECAKEKVAAAAARKAAQQIEIYRKKAEADARKAHMEKHKTADGLHTKLQKQLNDLRAMRDNPRFHMLPPAPVEQLDMHITVLTSHLGVCGAVMINPDAKLPSGCSTMTEATKLCVTAKSAMAVCASLIKTLGKLGV